MDFDIELVIILGAIILVPIFIGVFLTLRISSGEKKLNRILKDNGFVKTDAAREELEKNANSFRGGEDAYGRYIIHDPFRGDIGGNTVYLYKKIRFFTRDSSIDIKEFMFPMKYRSDSKLMVFFRGGSLDMNIINFFEERSGDYFTGESHVKLKLPPQAEGYVAYGDKYTPFNNLLSGDFQAFIEEMKRCGAFSFYATGKTGMIGFDPVNKKLDTQGIWKCLLKMM